MHEVHGMSAHGHVRRWRHARNGAEAAGMRSQLGGAHGHPHAARAHLAHAHAPRPSYSASSLMAEEQQMAARNAYWSPPGAGFERSDADVVPAYVEEEEAQRGDTGHESALGELQRYDNFDEGFNEAYNGENARFDSRPGPDDDDEPPLAYQPTTVRQALEQLGRDLPEADENARGALLSAQEWANRSARGILEAQPFLTQAALQLHQKLTQGHEAVRQRVSLEPSAFDGSSFAEEGRVEEFPDDRAYPYSENGAGRDDRYERYEPSGEWRRDIDEQNVDGAAPEYEEGGWY